MLMSNLCKKTKQTKQIDLHLYMNILNHLHVDTQFDERLPPPPLLPPLPPPQHTHTQFQWHLHTYYLRTYYLHTYIF